MMESMNTSVLMPAYRSNCKAHEGNATTFIAQAARLKVQQDCLDKEQALTIKHLRHLGHHVANDIAATHKEMEYQRTQESEKLRHLSFSILQSLKQLRADVMNEDKLRQLEVEYYQKCIYDLEEKIRNFRKANDKRFQKLLKEEYALSNELKSLESKYNVWNRAVSPSVLKPPVRRVSKLYVSNTDSNKAEVLGFQRFLQETGGHAGGWAEEDHLLFLQLRKKHKGKITFLNLLKEHLPDISADDMLLHEDWFQQYEILKAKQKKAIQEWRISKDKSSPKNSNAKSDPLELQPGSKAKYHEGSAEKKQKIEEWKKMLQLKKEMEVKKQWEDKQKEVEREQKRRERQTQKKLEVERYKEEKLIEQQSKVLSKQLKELCEVEERAAQANILQKAFREQDQLFVTRQLSRRKWQTMKTEQRNKQLETLKQEVTVDRDPKRLLRDTAAWREHCKQKPETTTFSHAVPVLHLRNVPHLKVPVWRRGLT